MNKRVLCALVLCSFFTAMVFSEGSLGDRYLNAANDAYSTENYEKAYKYVNSAMTLYLDEPVPANVILLAQIIYVDYMKILIEDVNEESYADVKIALEKYPLIVNDSISELIQKMDTAIVERMENEAQKKLEQVTAEEQKKQRELFESQIADLKKVQEKQLKDLKLSQEQAIVTQKEMIDSINAQNDRVTTAITKSSSQAQKNSDRVVFIIAIVGIGIFFVFFIVIALFLLGLRKNKLQQEQFQATLELVAKMNRTPNEQLALGSVRDMYDSLKSAGGATLSSQELPEPELTEVQLEQMNELAIQCERMGAEIDFITGRKNNSKNVAELVYKLSTAMGINPAKAKVYFCAAMVYDAGFLSISPDLLQAEKLNDEEKYEIRSHVQKGVEKLDFIPDQYRQIFIDAATMHHENMDGSGYPGGVTGKNIPTVARVIHVAETFISLISRRHYRGIMDKESALAELKSSGNTVDQKIVLLLDSIV